MFRSSLAAARKNAPSGQATSLARSLHSLRPLCQQQSTSPGKPSPPPATPSKSNSTLDAKKFNLGVVGGLLAGGLLVLALPDFKRTVAPDSAIKRGTSQIHTATRHSPSVYPTVSDYRIAAESTDEELWKKRISAWTGPIKPLESPVQTYGAQVAANPVCEDSWTAEVLPHPSAGGQTEKWCFHGVFDGHIGSAVSRMLSQVLVGYVVRELNPLYENGVPEPTDEAVTAAIKRAFLKCDDDIVSAALKELQDEHTSPARAATLLTSSLTGSCALLSFYDSRTGKLRVACTGDSRAVLGRREAGSPSWTTTPLSVDQAARAEAEMARVRAEHPGEEGVLKDGRLLGLACARSFGDADWKWAFADKEELKKRWFWHGSSRWGTRADTPTPPYLVAEPEVTTVVVAPGDRAAMVLASDGMWDEVASEQGVQVLEEYRARLRAAGGGDGRNVAEALVRRALDAGQGEDKVAAMLRAGHPLSRNQHDDVTVLVVEFGDALKPDA